MVEPQKKNLALSLALVYATVFIDQLGYSFVLPILPYFVEELHGNSFEMGILVGSYAFTQAISAYVMGTLSDKYGRKPFIIASLIGSLFGPILQSISWNMTSFIIFRALTGLLAGSITLGQSVITDCIPVEERSKYMAQVCGVISFAFAFGPAIGGFLSEWALRVPFYFAGGLALIVLILVLIFLHETLVSLQEKDNLKRELKSLKRLNSYTSEQASRIETINNKLKLLDEQNKKDNSKNTHVKVHWNIYMILSLISRFFNESSTIIIESMYGMYIKDIFGASTMDFSLILCTTGVVTAVIQFAIFPYIHDKLHFSIATTSWFAGVCIIAGFLCMAYVPYLWFSYISCNLMYMGYALVTPLSPAIISAQAPPSVQGHAISIGIIVGQVAMVLSPPTLGIIYEYNTTVSIAIGAVFGLIIFICNVILYFIPGGKRSDIVSLQSNLDDSKVSSIELTEKDKENALNSLETKSPEGTSIPNDLMHIAVQVSEEPVSDNIPTSIHAIDTPSIIETNNIHTTPNSIV